MEVVVGVSGIARFYSRHSTTRYVHAHNVPSSYDAYHFTCAWAWMDNRRSAAWQLHGSLLPALLPNYLPHLHHSPRLVMVFPPRCYATLLRSPSITRECRSLPTFFTNYSGKAQRICRDMGVVCCSNIPPDARSALAPVTSRRTGE